MSSELNHWYLDATVYGDRVEEVYYISDPVRNVRRKRQTRVWKVEQLLGHGSFGQVRLEKNQEDGQMRAVKRITTTSAALSNSECERELKALLEFSKPKFKEAAVFVEFFGWFKHDYDIFLAMEYVYLGDLQKNVVANSGKIPENEARDIAEQILRGLEIMHSESFAHRDLKPENVLVVHGPPQWWVKLADFGLSKRLTNTTRYNTRGGTPLYMAPEIFDFLNPDEPGLDYTDTVDIWSAGCIVYRLITGVVPFPGYTSLTKYCEDKSLFPFDALFDSGIKSEGVKFLRQLLVTKPSARPSATQALNHNWILSGSSTERMPPKTMSSEPLEENSGLSNPTSSETGYNTASHAGLQSDPSLPSSFSQTVLLPLSAPKISLSSHDTTIGLYPIRSAPTYTQDKQVSSPDGKLVALPSGDKTAARLWAVRYTLEGHTDSVGSVAFSPDGKLVASGSQDRTVRLWDLDTGAVRYTLEGHTGPVHSIAFSPDGKLVASGSYRRAVRLWDSDTGAVRRTVDCRRTLEGCRTLEGFSSGVTSDVFSPDGKLVAMGVYGRTVPLWDSDTGAVRHTLEGFTGPVCSIVFSPDSKLVAIGSFEVTVRLWDLDTGAVRYTLEGHTGPVHSIAFSPDGKLVASGSQDRTVRLWDLDTGAIRHTLEGHTECVHRVAFSPDGKLMASVSGSMYMTMRLWDLDTGAVRYTLDHASPQLVFSPDSKLIAPFCYSTNVPLCDLDTGAVRCILRSHTSLNDSSFAYSVAFSPDSKLVALGFRDGTVQLWAEK